MGHKVTFETPEDIELSFEVAGPGSRLAAGLIDMLIIAIVLLGVLATAIATEALTFSIMDLLEGRMFEALSKTALVILVGVVSGINLGYFMVSEWLLDGQSPGKKVVGLRVVRDGGYALNGSASLIRNIARVVDMLPGPYLVGLFSIVLSKQSKRLGDFMAGTIVIRHRPAEKPPAERRHARPTGPARFALGRPQIERLPPKTFGLLDDFLARRDQLDADSAAELEVSLARQIAEAMEVPLPAQGEVRPFLEEVYWALHPSR